MTNRRQILQSLSALAILELTARAVSDDGAAHAQQPNALPPDTPARDLVLRRAIEAMIWGMPAVNLDLMHQAMVRETQARNNQMLYRSRLLDWKNQTLTPNTDVIYLTPYFDTEAAGPMVIEIPPADDGIINGTIMDAWQMPLVAEPGTAIECRWIGGSLFWARLAGWQRGQLGADAVQRTIRSPVPLLWSRQATVRQDVDPAGYRGMEAVEHGSRSE